MKTTICGRTHLGKRAHVPICDLGFSNTFSLEECNGECKGKKHHMKNKYKRTQVFFCISFCIYICSRVHTFVLMFKFGRWSTSTTFWRITRSTGAGFKNISGFINYFSPAQNFIVHLMSLFPRFQISKTSLVS